MEVKCETKDTLPLSSLTEFQGGLKIRTDTDYSRIIKSIKNYGFSFPFFVWKKGETNYVIDGHGRLGALKRMIASGETVPDLPVVYVNAADEYEAKNLLLRLNSHYGKMTSDTVQDFIGDMNINLADLDLPSGTLEIKLDAREADGAEKEKNLVTLRDRFIVPPFSILDTRQGYWQDRKRLWLKITGDLTETRVGEFGQTYGGNSHIFDGMAMTSTFDPVLAEIVYSWFCPPKGKIIDPFGGEQTKGVVAGVKGYSYEAVEIRPQQVALNEAKTKEFGSCKYHCGDSNNLDQLITDSDFDLCFTSPPYYDLEVYSKEDMSALGTYEQFMEQYKNIFQKIYDKLKPESFLVVKIGEIRNKKTGIYRGFVPDNIKIMESIGFKYYNEIILINAISTTAYRAGNSMGSRKVGKCHQNVLVFKKDRDPDAIQPVHENVLCFFKGDEKKIPEKFPVMEEALDDELLRYSEQTDQSESD